jgi:hypothetical protein
MPSPRERWLRVAVEVGTLVAPAGFNFVVSGTTWWLYTADSIGLANLAPPWALHPTGVRVPFEPEALRRELARLSAVDALWRARLGRSRLRPPRPHVTRLLRQRIEATARELPEFALGDFVLRSAALLEATRLIPEYHRPDGAETGYVFDLLENGLTLLGIGPAGAPR